MTNGSYFAVDQQISEVWSASVERCHSVGVTPYSPSFFDYAIGKSYARRKATKENIKAVRPYFVNARTNALDLLIARDSAAWVSDAEFLSDCGLPTNAIDETPIFKCQYPSVTGGLFHTWIMLTNMVATENSGSYFPLSTNTLNSDVWQASSYQNYGSTWESAKSNITARWDYLDIFPFPPSRYYQGYQYSTEIEGEAYSSASKLGYTAYPGFYRSASVYHKAGAFTDETLGWAITNNIFDPQGCSVSNGWYFVGNTSETNSETETGLLIGIDGSEFNDPGTPDPPDAPLDTSPVLAVSVKGWTTLDQRIILKWTATTNGFKYK
jgi:hypothetical protein